MAGGWRGWLAGLPLAQSALGARRSSGAGRDAGATTCGKFIWIGNHNFLPAAVFTNSAQMGHDKRQWRRRRQRRQRQRPLHGRPSQGGEQTGARLGGQVGRAAGRPAWHSNSIDSRASALGQERGLAKLDLAAPGELGAQIKSPLGQSMRMQAAAVCRREIRFWPEFEILIFCSKGRKEGSARAEEKERREAREWGAIR